MGGYNYNKSMMHFDDTILTYGTDYLLAIIMSCIAYSLFQSNDKSNPNIFLRKSSIGLFVCYAISVFAGGCAHHFFTTFELRTTFFFRVIWTISVGSVCAASGFMGCIATNIMKIGHKNHISEWFWIGFSFYVTVICVFGGLSYQRPACDIFIAGTTQFPCTVYMIVALLMTKEDINMKQRIIACIGFLFNSPLLPLYSLVVHYTDYSLAFINTILHFCLFIAWTTQGLSLIRICNVINNKKFK